MPAKKLNIRKIDKNMSLQSSKLIGMKWYDPKKPAFCISGFAWFRREKLYRRLPAKPKWKISEAVDSLANCTAGGQIRFRTDSKRLAIKVLLSGVADNDHLTATGQCGFDCYIGAPGKKLFIGTTRFDHTKLIYEYLFFNINNKKMRNITLNFPLYQGVKNVSVGVDRGSKVLRPLPYKNDKKVIIYGTSITQGGCASRPGMAFTNILSRRFDREFINLGFSGNGQGEPELARLILEIEKPALFILDYEANCKKEMLKKTLSEFIRILRSRHRNIPIVVISRIKFASDAISKDPELRLERLEIQRKIVKELKTRGDKNIIFLDGSSLLGHDFEECTVDGVHPTDLGFMRIADKLTPVIKKLLV